jgi:hypothetical protein
MSDTELTVQHGAVPAAFDVDQVAAQVQQVQRLMEKMMIEGEHYGTIPGTSKKTLLKAGAEKLGFMFRLAPKYIATQTNIEGPGIPPGHREIKIKCELWHIPTNTFVAEGLGSCSTMESKYRYRRDTRQEELGAVPTGYWPLRNKDSDAAAAMLSKAYGSGKLRTKKIDGEWTVIRITGTGEQIENPDIADVYNTVLKMATKRANIAATLSACAASDIFTQDMEEAMMPTNGKTQKPKRKKSAPKNTTESSESQSISDLLNTRKGGKPVFTPGEIRDYSMRERNSEGDEAALRDIRQAIINKIGTEDEPASSNGEGNGKEKSFMDEVREKAMTVNSVEDAAPEGENSDGESAGIY